MFSPVLCGAEAVGRGGAAPAHALRTGFDARIFMVLADVNVFPACLTGWLGEEGYIERSLIYLRELDPVRSYYADLLRVTEHVRLNHCNESFRELLAAHDDPPLPDASRAAHPPGAAGAA